MPRNEVDYGSATANAAVKRIEKLGASVYPPGNKDAVDWGVLAGILNSPAPTRFERCSYLKISRQNRFERNCFKLSKAKPLTWSEICALLLQ